MQRTPVNRAIALALAAATGGALVLGLSSPASAHAALVSTDPEAGAVVAEAPAGVSATFSEPLDGPSTEIAVTDPAGAVIELEDPTFGGDTFTQAMLYTTPGTYTVAFRVISEDGHRVDDTLSFTVESIPEGLYVTGFEPTGEASSEAGATDAATTEAEATEESPRATGGMGDEDSNTGAALAAILLGFLVVVVGGVVLVKTLGRKQKTDDGEGGEGSA